MNKIILASMFAFLLSGCAQQMSSPYGYGVPARAVTPPPGGPVAINSNWRKNCTEDRVKNVKRCFVGTFGDMVGADGSVVSGAVGKNVAPFQIVYFNGQGPYLNVGHNDFPGRSPTIRIGEGNVIEIDESAKVSSEVISQLLESDYLLASYNVWPEGRRDMRVDLSGIEEALEELENLIK
jgi:ABC-type amino acid transport substrate-binding protein